MPIALVVGPAVALIGIVSVFFVLRRKSVEKRSMYSARRSQIEHKVRAARQRTLTPHSRGERPEAPAMEAQPSPFAPTQAAPAMTYQPAAYQPPPATVPPPPIAAPDAPARSPWDVGPTAPAAPTPPPFMPPPPAPETYSPEPFTPAPQPAFEAAPGPVEPAWTPGPAPSEPVAPIEPVRPAAPASTAAGWSIVNDARDVAATAPGPKKKDKKGAPTGSSWTLASGDAPGSEAEDAVKKPSATIAIAQYAVLVVGLIMVLIGVLVMVANSHG